MFKIMTAILAVFFYERSYFDVKGQHILKTGLKPVYINVLVSSVLYVVHERVYYVPYVVGERVNYVPYVVRERVYYVLYGVPR